jgi:hypothetical protein
MTDKRCSVVFRGDIVIGKSLPEVKQKLKKIFKVDGARIDSLFLGTPVPLKTKLSLPEAEKYKAILEQAGIVVAIESAQNDGVKSAKKPLVSETNTPIKAAVLKTKKITDNSLDPSTDTWRLAPVGSLLQDKKVARKQKEIAVNVDHLSVAAQEGNLIKDNERVKAPSPAVNADVLDWELTPYGETLLKEAEKKKLQVVEVDTTSLSVLENEGSLFKGGEKKKVEGVNVDTSHLSLVSDE